ncbi:MFS transporter [Sinorhizobium meliloti]|nr:MFS transporter [Sinorhizobium meliloti]
MATVTSAGTISPGKDSIFVILAVSFCHMLNDIMQSLLTALYPLLKENYALDFVQIGLLTFTFQVTASMLQPAIGIVTDRWALPYSLPFAMLSTCMGLLLLANADHFWMLLLAASLIGIGSAIFHPESSRVARLASGGRHGLAQSLFQVGGNAGSALGPLLAAFIVLPFGQGSLGWFSIVAITGFFVLSWVSMWYVRHRRATMSRPVPSRALPLPKARVLWTIAILVLLTATKNVYLTSISSYFTFFVIERFGTSVQQAQLMLFLFLGSAAAGTFLGGPIGDRYGARFVIWFSILGVVPFTLLLPYANLFWTGVLSVIIGLIFSSAFSAIVVFAQELVPGRVGLIAGVFFGFAFGAGGMGAAVLGVFADRQGIEFVYKICSYLPLLAAHPYSARSCRRDEQACGRLAPARSLLRT